MKPAATEAEVLKSIQEYAQLVLGIQLHRRNTGGVVSTYKGKTRFIKFGTPGMADLWGAVPKTARHIEVEVKALGKKPTPEQFAWLTQWQQLGAIAFYADSLDHFIDKWKDWV